MHRMKIGLAAAGTLLVVTFALYSSVSSVLTSNAVSSVEQGVRAAARAGVELGRLRAVDSAMQAGERARRPSVIAVFDKEDEVGRRQAAYEECEALNAGRKAAIVAIIDANGKVVARDLNPNALVGEDLKARYPAVVQVLKGEPVKDVWTWDNRITQVALAPIVKPDGAVVGALLIGQALQAKMAQETRDAIGAEIGYFHAGKIHASSFGSAEDANKEDVGKSQALGNFLFGADKLAEQALSTGVATPLIHRTIEGREYAILAAPLPGNLTDKSSGVIVARSFASALGDTQDVPLKILMLGGIAIIVALGATVLTAKRFIGPLDKIELGVAEIINGNIDFTFKPVGPDFEGLSNGLNVMLARLLGREEPNEDAVEEEEEGGGRKWKAEQMNIDESGTGAPASEALAKENEAAYYPRLFNEYVGALRKAGKPSEGVSVPAFMAKLRLTEGGLRSKWNCRAVRFELTNAGGEVAFRAVKID